MRKLSATERALLQRLQELEVRLSVLENLPTPIVFAVGKYPDPIRADMQAPTSDLEH